MIHPHLDRDQIAENRNHAVFQFIKEIDAHVQISAQNALFLSNLDRQRPKQARWYDDAHNYLYSHNHDIPPFLYVHYGSAVEDLVNMRIRGMTCPAGIQITLQQEFNGTRPDIVIKFQGAAYAWLDITSKRNKGHIYRKANWFNSSLPFIAELLYTDLSRGAIRENPADHIGRRAHFNHMIRMHDLNERVLICHMMKCTNHALARLSGRLRNDTRKSVISNAFTSAFNLHSPYPCIHLCIKAILHRYRNSCEIMHQNTAAEIYNRFYSDDTSQSWEKAREMITKSYQRSKEACQP